jgi:NAD+ kinase
MKISFLASQSPKAQSLLEDMIAQYGQTDTAGADIIVALGGDGFMLEVLHATRSHALPVYGINQGTVGFLMNSHLDCDLLSRISKAHTQSIHPLLLQVTDRDGRIHKAHAINEVSALRHGSQAANIQILIDGKERMENLMCDGVMLATPAGSTAYNYSAFGPILPFGANVLALTPIAAFRPRRWRGAVLPQTAEVTFVNRDPDKRPLMVNADSLAFSNAVSVKISVDWDIKHSLMFDPGQGLEDRVLSEQFM